jgi:uncharacterized phage protein gp47/JayE
MAIRQIYTLSQIVNRLINRMTATSTITDYTPGSNIRTIFESIGVFIEYIQFLIEEAYRSFYIDSAVAADLDKRTNDFGIQRKAAKASTGIIKFQRNTPATSTFSIAGGIEISTEPDVFGNTISYELDDNVTFVSGAIETTGAITCLITGPEGNVASGTITNITSDIPGVDAIVNPYALTDGASEETDEQLRKRVPVFLNGLKRGSEDAIRSAVLGIDGVTLVGLKENNPLPGYITVYVSNESGQLTEQQLKDIKEAAENAAAFGVQTNLVVPTIEYVTIELDVEIDTDLYDVEVVKETIRIAIDQYIKTNPESTVSRYEIILAANVPGVINIDPCNVKINGIDDDYTGTGDFVVVRLLDKDLSITINSV